MLVEKVEGVGVGAVGVEVVLLSVELDGPGETGAVGAVLVLDEGYS